MKKLTKFIIENIKLWCYRLLRIFFIFIFIISVFLVLKFADQHYIVPLVALLLLIRGYFVKNDNFQTLDVCISLSILFLPLILSGILSLIFVYNTDLQNIGALRTLYDTLHRFLLLTVPFIYLYELPWIIGIANFAIKDKKEDITYILEYE